MLSMYIYIYAHACCNIYIISLLWYSLKSKVKCVASCAFGPITMDRPRVLKSATKKSPIRCDFESNFVLGKIL